MTDLVHELDDLAGKYRGRVMKTVPLKEVDALVKRYWSLDHDIKHDDITTIEGFSPPPDWLLSDFGPDNLDAVVAIKTNERGQAQIWSNVDDPVFVYRMLEGSLEAMGKSIGMASNG